MADEFDELLEEQQLPPPKAARPVSMTEQEYVDQELAITSAQFAGRAQDDRNAVTFEERMTRAEQYARWRYREYLVGNVKRL